MPIDLIGSPTSESFILCKVGDINKFKYEKNASSHIKQIEESLNPIGKALFDLLQARGD